MSATLNSTATVKLVTDITQMRQRLAELGRIQRKLTDDERRERRNLANEVKALDREVIRNRVALNREAFRRERKALMDAEKATPGLSATGSVGAGNLAQAGGAVLGGGALKLMGTFFDIQKVMQAFNKLMGSIDKAAESKGLESLSTHIGKLFDWAGEKSISAGSYWFGNGGLQRDQRNTDSQFRAMQLAQARAAAEARRRESMDNARLASADAYENAVRSGTPAQRARARAAAMRSADQRRREIERSNTFTASVANVGQSYDVNARGIASMVEELRKLNYFVRKNGLVIVNQTGG